MHVLAPPTRRGFTLVELLVVLTILAILMGVLFPVFAAARRSAQATTCLANFKHGASAALLYTTDYDDRLMPINHQPGRPPDSTQDRVWPQLLLSYLGNAFKTFECPTEPIAMAFGGGFDPDLVPGDYMARYYDSALRSDLGYNGYYLAPIVRNGDAWESHPRSATEPVAPAKTLLFVESRAQGGGSYLVAPPCRYAEEEQGYTDTFLAAGPRATVDPSAVFTPIVGWDVSGQQSTYPTGGVGARHNGYANVAWLDGHVHHKTLNELTAGCEVRSAWQGPIRDVALNVWYGTQ